MTPDGAPTSPEAGIPAPQTPQGHIPSPGTPIGIQFGVGVGSEPAAFYPVTKTVLENDEHAREAKVQT